METFVKLLNTLQIKQTNYLGSYHIPPELDEYPIEYEHLNRCLIKLGEPFVDYKISSTITSTFKEAVIYCLTGKQLLLTPSSYPSLYQTQAPKLENHQNICDDLNIHIFIIGPELENIKLLSPNNINQNLQNQNLQNQNLQNQTPLTTKKYYILIYKSYENLYFPILSIKTKKSHIFCEEYTPLITQLLEKLKQPQ